MKVVLVHNQQLGGAHRRIAAQLEHLGIPVTEVTFTGAAPVTDDAVIVPLTRLEDGPNRLIRPVTRYLDLLSLMRGYHTMDRVLHELSPDVVWMNPCRYLQSMWLSDDLARRSVFYCDEPRRIDYEAPLRKSTRPTTRPLYWPLRRITQRLDRSIVQRVPRIATNSSYTTGQIRAAYGRSSDVVRCGVAPHFRPAVGRVERGHLLSVGSLIPTKGHDLAIAAAGRASLGLPVVIASYRTDPVEEDRLRRIADGAGIDLVLKIGVSDEELVALYQSARVTLYLSYAEPFGLVSVEAQACGTPVIVSDEGGLPESIVQGVTGWAVPRTVESVAARLEDFADVGSAEAFGRAARAHSSQWSWQDSAKGLHGMLTEVAGS
jgi:glycosyltransferase involved in cell wall biosynthesis